MKIGFIGAGKVGTAMGQYFYSLGMTVTGYYSLSSDDAKFAAETVDGLGLSMVQLVDRSDIVFITVNDDAISILAKEMEEKDILLDGKIVVHTSGAHGSNLLANLVPLGASIVSMHPLQSFADVKLVQEELPKTAFSVEGRGSRFDDFKSWMSQWTDNWFEIKEEDKARYHMAAVIVSNYLVTVLNYGVSVMESIGLTEDKAIDALKPLIEGSVKNVFEKGKVHSLTGPISRGDVETIKNHLNVLHKNEEILYKDLGLAAVEIAKEKNPEIIADLDAIKDLLK